MTPSTIVLAILLTISPYPTTADSVYLVETAPVEMTIEQCLSTAAEINADEDVPYIMVCGPLPQAGPAV